MTVLRRLAKLLKRLKQPAKPPEPELNPLDARELVHARRLPSAKILPFRAASTGP